MSSRMTEGNVTRGGETRTLWSTPSPEQTSMAMQTDQIPTSFKQIYESPSLLFSVPTRTLFVVLFWSPGHATSL